MDYTNAAVMSSIDGMLKEDWVSQTIIDQYSRDTALLALIDKDKEMIEGTDGVFTMRLAPNLSTGARTEMGALPDPGRQTVKKVRVPLSYWYTTMAFSGPSIAASRSSAGSLARVVTDELDQGIKDHKKVENYYMYGDGSGALAQIPAGGISGNVITVDRWCPLFEVGRLLDSYTAKSGGAQHLDGVAITAVDREAMTVTVSAIGTTAAADFLFIADTRGAVNMGLLGICDDGTYVPTFQTLARATYPRLNGLVFTATAARDITEDLLLDYIARMREDGGKPDLLIGTSFQLRDLCSEAKEQRRFIDPKTSVDLGISGIKIGDGVDFTWDSDCLPGFCFPLTRKALKIGEMAPLGFMDKDGNVLSRIAGKDGYEAALFHYYNLFALSCFNQGRIENLNENRVGD